MNLMGVVHMWEGPLFSSNITFIIADILKLLYKEGEKYTLQKLIWWSSNSVNPI